MSKKVLRIYYVDMWGHGPYQFNPYDNYFNDLLSLAFRIIIDAKQPDILIYSCFGAEHVRYDCFKIFFSGENIKSGVPGACIEPADSDCNISFSKHPTSCNNYYLPLWVLFVNWFNKYQPRPLPSNPTYSVSLKDLTLLARERSLRGFEDRKPLMFINNNMIKDRILLFLRMQERVVIDSYGKLFNNMSEPLRGSEYDKHTKLQEYRCTFALENSFHPGYVTEKIIQPYAAGCIAIYRGGLDLSTFNEKSMILYDRFNYIDDLVEEVQSVCLDRRRWLEYAEEPLFKDNIIPEEYFPKSIIEWILPKLPL